MSVSPGIWAAADRRRVGLQRGTVDMRQAPRPTVHAFTIIEVLVVVAITALLIAVLMPSLRMAREHSRAAVCLSNLKQQGIALASYSAESDRRLPWAGSFRFDLLEGLYYIFPDTHPEKHNWSRVNLGLLYPKHVSRSLMLFYCPGNRFVDAGGENGTSRFLQCYKHPLRGDPQYIDAHNFPLSPYGAYAYALPAAHGASPLDKGDGMFPDEVVHKNPFTGSEWPYWKYLTDTTGPDASFLPVPPVGSRGKHNVHALVSDGYFRRDYYGYHIRGHNVLYSDFHARRVNDPNGKIYNANMGAPRPDRAYDARIFQVWDYFSKNN